MFNTDSSARPGRARVYRPPSEEGRAKVVYFVVTHHNPEQITRLVRTLRTTGGPDAFVLIHHDYKASYLDPKPLQALGNVHILTPPSPVQWGSFSACQMILRAMRYLTKHVDFDWVSYISGQDYPIVPAEQIERCLATTPHDGFLHVSPVQRSQWFLGIERYLYRYYDVPRFPGAMRIRRFLHEWSIRRRAAGETIPRFTVPADRFGARHIGVRPLDGPFGLDFDCYVGSAWWTIRRSCIEHILRFVDRNPVFLRHYEHALFAPNESFFLTALMNNPAFTFATRDNKRFLRWSNPVSGHPDMLGVQHYEDMIATQDHFARKIDLAKSPQLLDLLDQHIRRSHGADRDGPECTEVVAEGHASFVNASPLHRRDEVAGAPVIPVSSRKR